MYAIQPNLRDDVGYYGMYYTPTGEEVMVQGADYNDVSRKLNEMYDNESSPTANINVPKLSTVKIDLESLSVDELKNVVTQLKQKEVNARANAKAGKQVLITDAQYKEDREAVKNYVAALEAQTSAEVSGKIDTFVEKGGVTEQSIFDQLDNIQPCF